MLASHRNIAGLTAIVSIFGPLLLCFRFRRLISASILEPREGFETCQPPAYEAGALPLS